MSFPKKPVDNVRSAKTPEEVLSRIREVFGEAVSAELRERKGGKEDGEEG